MNEHSNIDERAWVLLNGQMDGELSGSEQQELDILLADSEELRAVQTQLNSMSECLHKIPEKEPPGYLHNAITSTVRLPVSESGSRSERGFGHWITTNWLGPVFALTAGVLLTVGVYETGPGAISAADTANMTGTMLGSRAATKGELLDRFEIDDSEISGSAQLSKSGKNYLLEVQLDSDLPAVLTLGYAANELEFMGVASTANPVESLAVSQNKVTVEGKGEQRFTLLLRARDNQTAADTQPGNAELINAGLINIELAANDGQLFKTELKSLKN